MIDDNDRLALAVTDVDALNLAREVLKRLTDDARLAAARWKPGVDPTAHDLGRFSEAAEVAEDMLFNVLNVANSYTGIPLTHKQLHLREEQDEEAA